MKRTLDEDQLGAWLARASGPLLRHETNEHYAVASDGSDYSRYLDGEAAPSPEVGAAWREFVRPRDVYRVRVLYSEPSHFLRFECEWQYVVNAQAGERIRVLDVSDGATSTATDRELWVTEDGVAVMHYRTDGTFSHADLMDNPTLARAAWVDYHAGEPFAAWWDGNPQWHRASWLEMAAGRA